MDLVCACALAHTHTHMCYTHTHAHTNTAPPLPTPSAQDQEYIRNLLYVLLTGPTWVWCVSLVVVAHLSSTLTGQLAAYDENGGYMEEVLGGSSVLQEQRGL